MMTLGTARIVSAAAPAAFFARWADMATWPEWNADTEWVRLDGPFATGSTGVLKPKGGPKTKFVISEVSGERFTDVSMLVGARLTFDHRIQRTAEGGSEVQVTVSLGGPLALLWNQILGKGIKKTLQRDLEALREAAEAKTGEADGLSAARSSGESGNDGDGESSSSQGDSRRNDHTEIGVRA
ncbi:MAG TPA: SRPBCC family protein [Actinocrinis sp.]|nr:SRPBCC family protein [Actinocrinis sp.]